MKNTRKIVALGLIAMTSLSFMGCSKKVKLEEAIQNTSKVKSYSYSATANAKEDNEMDITFKLSGDIKETNAEFKMSSNLEVQMNGISFKTPFMAKTVDEKSELFIGTDIFKLLLGGNDLFGEKEYLYISTDEIFKFLKENGLDNKEYEEMLKPNKDVSKKLNENLFKTFIRYLNKNKDICKFEKLEGKATSKNGIYEITLTDKDIMNIFKEFITNDENYDLLKKYSPEIDSKEELLNQINSYVDKIKDTNSNKTLKLEIDIEIEDCYIKNIIGSVNSNGQSVAIAINLSNFDKVEEISMPNKTDNSVLNALDFYKELTENNNPFMLK